MSDVDATYQRMVTFQAHVANEIERLSRRKPPRGVALGQLASVFHRLVLLERLYKTLEKVIELYDVSHATHDEFGVRVDEDGAPLAAEAAKRRKG